MSDTENAETKKRGRQVAGEKVNMVNLNFCF